MDVNDDTYLNRNIEDLGNEDHHWNVIRRLLHCLTRHKLLKHWEKELDQLIKGKAILLDFKFEGLEDALECAQS